MKDFRKTIALLALCISIVGVVFWQMLLADNVSFYITSVAVLILSMLPFFVSFEVKKTTSREISLIATLIAIAVASRAAFYLIPQVKPIAAVVIVSAVCLGAERGFVVGAFSAFISNFIFGQGFYTPFQMVALGAVGLIAGIIFKLIKTNKWSLAIVGFVLASAVYGCIVDLSTVLMMYGNSINLGSLLSVYGAGVPFSLVFGTSTAVFLFIFGMPFIKKIERINTKYNLIKK